MKIINSFIIEIEYFEKEDSKKTSKTFSIFHHLENGLLAKEKVNGQYLIFDPNIIETFITYHFEDIEPKPKYWYQRKGNKNKVPDFVKIQPFSIENDYNFGKVSKVATQFYMNWGDGWCMLAWFDKILLKKFQEQLMSESHGI